MFKMIRAIFRGIPVFLENQWNQYNTTGQFLWVLALVAMFVDAGICYQYGISLSLLHAAGFALVAIAFAVLPDIASLELEKGNKLASGILAAACVPLCAVAYQSHIGYSAGIRVGEMQQATKQNVDLKGKQDDGEKLKEKIEFLESRRESLDSEMDKLVNIKVNDWSVAVRPSSAAELDGAIESKKLEAANESKRKGCKSKCEARNNELAHLIALRAKAAEIKKNEEMHAATLAGLANARNVAGGMHYASSTAVNQSDVFAKLANFVTGGVNDDALHVTGSQRELTNTALMGSSSLAFLILAPLLNFAAGRNRKTLDELAREYLGPEAGHAVNQDPKVIHRHTVIKKTDNAVARSIKAQLDKLSEPQIGYAGVLA
jgi:hypothetical protein